MRTCVPCLQKPTAELSKEFPQDLSRTFIYSHRHINTVYINVNSRRLLK